MVLPGHLAGGYLATLAVLGIAGVGAGVGAAGSGLSHEQLNALLVIGTLAGDLPDIDLIRLTIEERLGTIKVKSHREYFTHAAAFWMIIGLVVIGAGFIFGSVFTKYLGLILWAGTWSHLIFDSIEDGVMWLWPFSKKRYSLLMRTYQAIDGGPHSITYYWNFITREYPRYWTFYAEVLVTVVAIWVFLK